MCIHFDIGIDWKFFSNLTAFNAKLKRALQIIKMPPFWREMGTLILN